MNELILVLSNRTKIQTESQIEGTYQCLNHSCSLNTYGFNSMEHINHLFCFEMLQTGCQGTECSSMSNSITEQQQQRLCFRMCKQHFNILAMDSDWTISSFTLNSLHVLKQVDNGGRIVGTGIHWPLLKVELGDDMCIRRLQIIRKNILKYNQHAIMLKSLCYNMKYTEPLAINCM